MAFLAEVAFVDSLKYAAKADSFRNFLSFVDPTTIDKPLYGGATVLTTFVISSRRLGDAQSDSERNSLRMKIVDQLLAWGANINAPGKMGKTALRRAIGRSDVPMVAHLLRRGADMRKVTTNKAWNSIRSAFDLEVLTRKPEDRLGYPISELLILHGAKLEEFRVCMTERSKEEDFQFYTDFYTRLRNARDSIVILLGVRRRSPLLKLIGKDLVLQLAKDLYSTRGNPVWNQAVP